jgi:hypothetical protein
VSSPFQANRPEVGPVLRVWGVRVQLGEVTYDIAPQPAADWIEAVLTGGPVPAMLSPEAADLVRNELAYGRINDGELTDAGRLALADAAGRPWWEVLRLVSLAEHAPDLILGELVRRGFDFEKRSIGAYCAGVVAIVTAGMDKGQRDKFMLTLATAPIEVAAEQGDEALSAAFLVAMNEVG